MASYETVEPYDQPYSFAAPRARPYGRARTGPSCALPAGCRIECSRRGSCGWTVFWWIVGILFFFWALGWFWKRLQESKEVTPSQANEYVIDVDPNTKKFIVNGPGTGGVGGVGSEAPTLNLRRGGTYRFVYRGSNLPPSPFYFTTSAEGGSGPSGQPVGRLANSPPPFITDTVVHVPLTQWPDTFYYQSALQKGMGGVVNLV
jgi:hypothetical protein